MYLTFNDNTVRFKLNYKTFLMITFSKYKKIIIDVYLFLRAYLCMSYKMFKINLDEKIKCPTKSFNA